MTGRNPTPPGKAKHQKHERRQKNSVSGIDPDMTPPEAPRLTSSFALTGHLYLKRKTKLTEDRKEESIAAPKQGDWRISSP